MTALDAALAYAVDAGARVFPCRNKNTPLVKWREEASTSIVQIVAWWENWRRQAHGPPHQPCRLIISESEC
jgi:hypothetical protein